MIKNFKQFLEAVSGTIGTFYGDFAPVVNRQKLPNTITSADTNVVYDETTDKFYSEDEYYDLYNKYIKKGGTPIIGGLNKENLEKVLNC
jgi:hypothetical protein